MRVRPLLLAAPLILGMALLLSAAPAYAAEGSATPEPILVIKNTATTPATLTVGQQFRLDVTIDNASDVDAENVVISVGPSANTATSSVSTTSSSVLGPAVVIGSNTKFIGDIAAGATGQVVAFDLTSNPHSSSGPCSVPVIITYDTDDGRKSVEQAVGFVLTRTLVFDVSALEYPKSATAGEAFEVAASVNNTNYFTVNGVTISFRSADATLSSAVSTMGPLAPGATNTHRAKLNSRKLGPLTVTLVIAYNDDFGQPKEIRRDFTVRIDAPKATPQATKPSAARTRRAQVLFLLRAFFGIGG